MRYSPQFPSVEFYPALQGWAPAFCKYKTKIQLKELKVEIRGYVARFISPPRTHFSPWVRDKEREQKQQGETKAVILWQRMGKSCWFAAVIYLRTAEDPTSRERQSHCTGHHLGTHTQASLVKGQSSTFMCELERVAYTDILYSS